MDIGSYFHLNWLMVGQQPDGHHLATIRNSIKTFLFDTQYGCHLHRHVLDRFSPFVDWYHALTPFFMTEAFFYYLNWSCIKPRQTFSIPFLFTQGRILKMTCKTCIGFFHSLIFNAGTA